MIFYLNEKMNQKGGQEQEQDDQQELNSFLGLWPLAAYQKPASVRCQPTQNWRKISIMRRKEPQRSSPPFFFSWINIFHPGLFFDLVSVRARARQVFLRLVIPAAICRIWVGMSWARVFFVAAPRASLTGLLYILTAFPCTDYETEELEWLLSV